MMGILFKVLATLMLGLGLGALILMLVDVWGQQKDGFGDWVATLWLTAMALLVIGLMALGVHLLWTAGIK
jgi:hypothetical protein